MLCVLLYVKAMNRLNGTFCYGQTCVDFGARECFFLFCVHFPRMKHTLSPLSVMWLNIMAHHEYVLNSTNMRVRTLIHIQWRVLTFEWVF